MIDPQITQQTNTSPLFFEDMETKFQSFHGRMVNLLSPLEENRICDVLARIVTLFASIVVYPAWGTVKALEAGVNAINACFIKNEKSSNVGVQTENSVQCKMIKKQIENDFKLWSSLIRLENFQGEKLKIYFGYKATDSTGGEGYCLPYTIEKTPEALFNKFNDFQKLTDTIYDIDTISIELLIIGELIKDPDIELVDYQFFKQSYIGKKGEGKVGSHSKEFENDFMEGTKHFELLEIPDQIWNDDGSFR